KMQKARRLIALFLL
ncbi:DNA ligase, partial [Haemophilus influenzae]